MVDVELLMVMNCMSKSGYDDGERSEGMPSIQGTDSVILSYNHKEHDVASISTCTLTT
jgi:hypothetical protein